MNQISRRQFLHASGSAVSSLAVVAALTSPFVSPVVAADLAVPGPAGNRKIKNARIIENWMNQWMKAAQAPGGTLHMSRFKDPMYFITKPGVGWKPNADQGKYPAVEVPVGFVTDFASIPRAFWSFLRPDGEYTYPAIVHDWMYWSQERPKEEADEILKFGMQDFDIEPATVQTIYQAVRLAGGAAWRGNARLKAQGEKRILKIYPDNPIITWAEWKRRPDVF
jgi:Protein of unknown function (DUF1353)